MRDAPLQREYCCGWRNSTRLCFMCYEIRLCRGETRTTGERAEDGEVLFAARRLLLRQQRVPARESVRLSRDVFRGRPQVAIRSSDRWLRSSRKLRIGHSSSSGHYSHGASGLCDKLPPITSRSCASSNPTMAMRSPLSHAVKRATWNSPATPVLSPCTQRWKRGNATVAPPPVTQSSAGSKGPTAMVFMNMGGPSTTDEVHGFLSNLFVRHDFKFQPPYAYNCSRMPT
jgi:hypothetical protein